MIHRGRHEKEADHRHRGVRTLACAALIAAVMNAHATYPGHTMRKTNRKPAPREET